MWFTVLPRMALIVLVLGIHVDVGEADAIIAAPAQGDAGREEGARTVDFIMAGLRNEREKFKSGECRFDGSLAFVFPKQPESSFSGPMKGRLAIEGDKLRFDLTKPSYVVDPSTIRTSAKKTEGRATAKMMKGTLTKLFADNLEKLTFWRSDNPLMTITRSGKEDRKLSEYTDIRVITLYDPISLRKCRTMAEILDIFFKAGYGYSTMNKAAKKGKDGRWELTWDSKVKNEATKYTLIVNEARGYTPEEFRCESKLDGAPAPAADWFLEWINQTRWDQIGGVWVPVHHEHRQVLGPMSAYSETYIYDYHWDSVNQDVPDDVFTYTKLDVPKTVAIQDVSTGETEWIREFPAPASAAPVSFWGTWTGMTVLAAALILGITGVGAFVLRGRKRPRNARS